MGQVVHSTSLLDQRAIAPETIRPIRRAEYDRMVEAGLFADERIELIRGALVVMSPQGTRHADATRKLDKLFNSLLGDRAEVSCQLPFAASDDSEPEPDIALHPPGDYAGEHPGRALLVVEVADTSLRKDRGLKADLYAEAGVPEYWVVDLTADQVEVMTEPEAGRYRRREIRTRADSIRLSGFPDVAISVADFLRRA
jgi:Uma2 family endonuclease